MVSFMPRPLYPREENHGTLWIEGWVGPTAGLNDMEKWKFYPHWDSNFDPLVVQPVASPYTDCAIPARTDWGRPRNTSIGIANIRILIRTENLPNTDLERYPCISLLCLTWSKSGYKCVVTAMKSADWQYASLHICSKAFYIDITLRDSKNLRQVMSVMLFIFQCIWLLVFAEEFYLS
jgi:hypothetical protein